jgi:hypothetical protein
MPPSVAAEHCWHAFGVYQGLAMHEQFELNAVLNLQELF